MREIRSPPKRTVVLMLRIDVGPGDLAATRFAVAPLTELGALLREVGRSRATVHQSGSLRRWSRRYGQVAGSLDARLIRALDPPGRWGVDFIAPPPVAGLAESVDIALATVRATAPPVAIAQIEAALNLQADIDPDVRAILQGPDAVDRIVGALDVLWHALIAPDWPLLRSIAERDVAYRGKKLVEGGWVEAMKELHPNVGWEPGNVVIRHQPDQEVQLSGSGLLLVPSVFAHPGLMVFTDPPWHPTLVYPARGSAALWQTRPRTPQALEKLLGRGRARILLQLQDPASTTQLAHITDYAAGNVSEHLKILQEAGLIQGSRAGRSVLYRHTALATALIGDET